MSEGLSDKDIADIERENEHAGWSLQGLGETRPPEHLYEAVYNVNMLLAEVRRLKAPEGKQP